MKEALKGMGAGLLIALTVIFGIPLISKLLEMWTRFLNSVF